MKNNFVLLSLLLIIVIQIKFISSNEIRSQFPNTHRIYDQKYNVNYKINYAVKPQRIEDTIEMNMRYRNLSKRFFMYNGIKYSCYYPKENYQNNVQINYTESEGDVSKLLTPLLNKCFKSFDGWWTYEFCYKKYVRQFAERDNDSILGKVIQNVHLNDDFYSEFYENGTICDAKKKERTVEVRYRCDHDVNSAKILFVKEPIPCEFVMEVATPYLCKHPKYNMKREIEQEILCFNYVDDKHYEVIEKEMEKASKLAVEEEEKRKKAEKLKKKSDEVSRSMFMKITENILKDIPSVFEEE